MSVIRLESQGSRDYTSFTLKQVADMLQVDPITIYRLVRNGILPAFRIGRQYRIMETDLRRYIEENRIRWRDGDE